MKINMKTLDKVVTYFEEYVSAICFALMSIITVAGVFFRYVLHNPIIWSEEVSRYLMIWGIFIGVSIVTRKKAQLGIDIAVNLVPEKFKKYFHILNGGLLILTYAIILYLSILFVLGAFETGQMTPILRIKFYYVYLAMPIGFLLCLYRSIQLFWHMNIKKDIAEEENEVYL